ncbi:hypothetical protein [Wenzhouxiangella sp. EGI_FJ10305]|uniref:hypothetical protein n=1 Tax=Wenzhouxiangella sp. EGI_FJ10305 TaxID=3243768 RepID=UPI0035E16D65
MKQLAMILILAALAAPAVAQDCDTGYCISKWTIASGGTMESCSGNDCNDSPEWKLKGTIGQWEATEPRELSGGQWKLTGGFWADTLQELSDFLFRDRFEEESS